MKDLSIRKVVIPYLLALALFLIIKDWDKIKTELKSEAELTRQELPKEN